MEKIKEKTAGKFYNVNCGFYGTLKISEES